MTELKKTPLHATHRALSARMVDFGGWEMPVNYGSQIDEHKAVRSDAGMCFPARSPDARGNCSEKSPACQIRLKSAGTSGVPRASAGRKPALLTSILAFVCLLRSACLRLLSRWPRCSRTLRDK